MSATPASPNLIDALVAAGRTYADNLATVLGVSLLLQGLKVGVFVALYETVGVDTGVYITTIWAWILLTLSFGVFTQLAVDVRGGVSIANPADLIKRALPLVPGLLGLAVVAAIGILFGLVLLIVPGIYLAIRWSVAAPAKVAGKLGITEAMSASWRLLDGFLLWAFLLVVFQAFVVELIPALADSFVGRDAPLPTWLLAEALISALISPVAALTAAMFFVSVADQHGALVPEGEEPVAPASDGPYVPTGPVEPLPGAGPEPATPPGPPAPPGPSSGRTESIGPPGIG